MMSDRQVTQRAGREILSAMTGAGSMRLWSVIVNAISAILVARALGPSGYGGLAIALAILNLLAIPSSASFTPLLARESALSSDEKNSAKLVGFLRWSGRAQTLVSFITVVALGAIVFFGSRLDLDLPIQLLSIGAGFLVMWPIAARATGILQGLKRVVLAQLFDWLVTPTVYFGIVLYLYLEELVSPTSVILASLGALCCGSTIGWLSMRNALRGKSGASEAHDDRSQWRASWQSFLLLQLGSVVNAKVALLLVGILAGDTETGIFRAAENMAVLLSLSLVVANAVLAPYITQYYAANQFVTLERIARMTARVALLVSLGPFFVFLVFGPELITFLFGSAYEAAYQPLVILLCAQVVNLACGSVGLLLNMTGHEKRALPIWALTFVVNGSVCLLLIGPLGAIGAAIASALSTVVWNLCLLRVCKQHLNVMPAVVSLVGSRQG